MRVRLSKHTIKKSLVVGLCLVSVIFSSSCAVLPGDVASQGKEQIEQIEDEIEEIEQVEESISEALAEELEEQDDVEEEPVITYSYTEEDMVDFDIEEPFGYCDTPICSINTDTQEVEVNVIFDKGIPRSDDDDIYLFDLSTYEKDEVLNEKSALCKTHKDKEVTLVAPYIERFLFARFVPAILYEGEYVPLAYAQYITNPEALATNTIEYPVINSKKGLLLDANTLATDKLYGLNVKRLVYNVPLSFVIGESDNPEFPTIEFEYNGETYYFNGYLCAGFDSLFTYLKQHGFHSTIIVLNDWNENHTEIIHPKSRKRTRKSLYYSFNTEEEEGVRLMEATAMFLAKRYSGGEYGMVYDWVIANEINQQTIWNYMDTDDLYYYTEEFEKSFRTFYNAIKSQYAEANVYFSIDHDFNNNGGNNRRFFNGRELLYTFNDLAKLHGNYDWGLSIHPYPAPLTKTRFWRGKFDKTEEAGVVTPMNLSSLTDVMVKKEFLDTKNEVRDIAVTELGFSSKPGEELQAAAFAYCYYIIKDNEYISSFLLNRQTDDTEALKSGLALGIYNNDYSSKPLADVFRYIDTAKGEEYIPQMLEIIGAESMEEALLWVK